MQSLKLYRFSYQSNDNDSEQWINEFDIMVFESSLQLAKIAIEKELHAMKALSQNLFELQIVHQNIINLRDKPELISIAPIEIGIAKFRICK